MTVLTAEVERRTRVIVSIEIEEFCAFYAETRKSDGFDGTDEEYVRSYLKEAAGFLLADFPALPTDDGVEVEGDWDELEVDILAIQ